MREQGDSAVCGVGSGGAYMIPNNSDSIVLTQIEKPSKTYRLNSDTNKTVGYCDKLEAVKQAVFNSRD